MSRIFSYKCFKRWIVNTVPSVLCTDDGMYGKFKIRIGQYIRQKNIQLKKCGLRVPNKVADKGPQMSEIL
ncbi:hypothetical protein Cyrtocomes_00476 [Candidatus Cyrtobacter comes]|uniref:Transposase n=1 Tax=Candidatus Cyrtobacter comes TaxID=675776 RepID=A0ABU5L7K6_9RICK|nr:hypothetical protein [Candidatus Cyrtobacter comes]MDZ5762108.1 hypothetical protein [Candidatus Cyrtobacter comes]